jgi:hypothetical protein
MRVAYFGTLFAMTAGACGIPTPQSSPKPYYLPQRLITFEQHVVSPSLEDEVVAVGVVQRYPCILDKLKDVGAGQPTVFASLRPAIWL